jgi:hypothetical protein
MPLNAALQALQKLAGTTGFEPADFSGRRGPLQRRKRQTHRASGVFKIAKHRAAMELFVALHLLSEEASVALLATIRQHFPPPTL